VTASPHRRVTHGDAIANALRQDIAYGNLRPHQRLTQDDISGRFEVSRMPARDAMRRLLTEGLLYQDEKVVRVAAMSASDITEVYRIAGTLHGMAAGCAARVCNDSLAAELATADSRTRDAFKADDIDRVEWRNSDLHRLINRSGTSARLRSLLGLAVLPAVRPGDLVADREVILHDHKAIVECIAERDVAGAEAAAYEHIFRWCGTMIQALAGQGLLAESPADAVGAGARPQGLSF
jgi:DNA-binding GntR family transcriptional regulator